MDQHSPGEPIHVCHVVLSLEPGGLENGVVNVVNGLNPAEFRSSVCCVRRKGEFASRIRADVPVATMGLKAGNDPRTVLRLAKLFRSTGVDIVHTRNAESSFYGTPAARLAGVPAVIHSEHGRELPESRRRAAVQRLLLRRVDAAFAVSEQLRTDLVRDLRLDESRFDVIHNGVDIRAFAPAGSCLDERGSAGPLRIGTVGRLVPVKNYALLVRVFSRLPHEPRCQLVLVGDGPERASLERLAADLGVADRLEFLGHRDDVPTILRSLDVFVLPSLNEGMSNTLLEAMAAGLPVLASDVGGNGEIIEPDKSGLLFPSQDIDSAVAQLRRLTESPTLRRTLGREGAERVRAEFSIEAMLRRYEHLYRKVWSARRG